MNGHESDIFAQLEAEIIPADEQTEHLLLGGVDLADDQILFIEFDRDDVVRSIMMVLRGKGVDGGMKKIALGDAMAKTEFYDFA